METRRTIGKRNTKDFTGALRMKLPFYLRRKFYQIGGKRFRMLCPYKFRERTDIKAQSDLALLQIRISVTDQCGNTVPVQVITESFWHEMTHIIDQVFNGGALDEATVQRLGEGLNQVMQQILPED